MIGIINITKEAKQTGPHEYALTINRSVLAHFTHNREDGLAVCLEKAAIAAREYERTELYNLYKVIEESHEAKSSS